MHAKRKTMYTKTSTFFACTLLLTTFGCPSDPDAQPTDGSSTGPDGTGDVDPETDAGDVVSSTGVDDAEDDVVDDGTTAVVDEDSSGGNSESTGDVEGPSQCDPWVADDCADGFKCMPYDEAPVEDSWDANGCFPADGTDAPGDRCEVFDSAVDGIDSCDATGMCLPDDFEDLTVGGNCIAFCEGDAPEAASCADPGETCVIANDGVLTICLTMCDPVLQECELGGCYLNTTDNGFFCFPQDEAAMGVDSGYQAPCGSINFCDPGLQCTDAVNVPGCTQDYCCTEFCDLDDPDADTNCSGNAQGQTCLAHFPKGAEPPGLEHVGQCGVQQ